MGCKDNGCNQHSRNEMILRINIHCIRQDGTGRDGIEQNNTESETMMDNTKFIASAPLPSLSGSYRVNVERSQRDMAHIKNSKTVASLY